MPTLRCKVFRAFAAIAFVSILTAGKSAAARDLADFVRPESLNAPYFAFNPTTPGKIAAGRKLFFDERLSGSNGLACASCHIEEFGWTDRLRFSLNDDGDPLTRRTQPLIGVGWTSKLGWSLGVDSLEGFALLPIAKAKEMGQDLDALVIELEKSGAYRDDMAEAFGSPDIKISRLTQSLAAFMRTLVPPKTAFDAWIAGDPGALSESAKTGFDLFVGKAGCAACHIGWRFTDDKFHDIGLTESQDIGRALHAPNDEGSLYAFKTPTLRGVRLRSPYMHDGSIGTLEAVIEHYVSGIRERPSLSPKLQPSELSTQEKLNVLDFLKTL